MIGGKKTTAQRIVYSALDEIEVQAGRPGIDVLRQALRNATPTLEVRSRRVGGATYQVPREVRIERQQALAMRWIVEAARGRGGRPMAQRLAQELMEASNGSGDAVRRREDIHRTRQQDRLNVSRANRVRHRLVFSLVDGRRIYRIGHRRIRRVLLEQAISLDNRL